MLGSSAVSLLSLAAVFPATLALPAWGPPWSAPWGYHTTTTWTYPEATPRWSYPASLPTTGYSTSMSYPTATGTAMGTATGTGYAYPTGWKLNKRGAEKLALEKREAFEGPRQGVWPHHWPAPYSCTEGWGSTGFATGSGYATGSGTGYAWPTATGSYLW